MRLSGTKTGSANQYNGLGDQLYDLGGARPTLDLNFASNGSLVDSVTGKTLVTHTRASSATYVDGDGVIRTAVTNLLLQSEGFSTTWGNSGSSDNTNVTTAPDGTLTADELKENNTTTQHYLFQNITKSAASLTYTLSVYVKRASGTRNIALGITDGSTGGYAAIFDPDDGSVISASNGIGNTTGWTAGATTSQAVGNGWWRYSFTVTSNTATTLSSVLYLINGTSFSYLGDNTSNIYIWGAQLEESSTVGQYVKTTTAINSAPRFDHDPTTGESLGLLVEESRTNLSPYSRYETSQWTFQSASVGTSTKSSIDGEVVTAFLTDATTNPHRVIRTVSGAYSAGTVVTFSFYVAKPAGSDIRGIIARIRTAAGGHSVSIGVSDDGEDSVYTFTSSTPFGASPPPAVTASAFSAIPINNKWTRISIVAQVSSINTNYTQWDIGFSSASSNDIGLGTANSELFIDAVQLEAGSFPTSYIPTEGSTVTRAADVTSITGRNFGSVNLVKYSEEFDNAGWTKVQVTLTQNVITAPDGTFTADKLVETTDTGTHLVTQGNSGFSAGAVVTASVYLKAGERTFASIGAPSGGAGTGINLSTGELVNVSVPGWVNSTVRNASSAGDGWWRVSFQFTATGSNGLFDALRVFVNDGFTTSYTGDGTSGIYVWGAQLEEGSTATDYIKSDVNWTSRASNATYYDVNGTLKKSSYNLLTYSEDFTNAIWPASSRATLLTATGVDNPFGGTNASTWKNGGTAANELIHRALSSQTAGIPYTYSVWLRRRLGTGSIIMRVGDNIPQDVSAQVTTEWNRIQVTSVPAGTTIRAYVEINGIGDEVDVWGAQLETGPYAGDYAKTEASAASSARNVAFLPDGSGNFVSAGELLLEDDGTNLVSDSEDFDQWNLIGLELNQNQVVAPDGTLTADEMLATSGVTSVHRMNFAHTFTVAGTKTASVYVKNKDAETLQLNVYNTTDGNQAIVVVDFSDYSITSGSGTVTPVGNGWYRISVTGDYSAIYSQFFIQLLKGGTNNFEGDGKGVYLWGAQLEANPYPTSYIPTYGSTATRAADVSTSAATFGNSWYEQSEGTVFSSSRHKSVTARTLAFTDGTSNNAMQQYLLANTAAMDSYVSNSWQGSGATTITFVADQQFNVASTIQTNSGVTAASGALGTVDTNYGIPTVDRLLIGQSRSSDNTNGTIRRLTYWPTRLSNDTLQTITR